MLIIYTGNGKGKTTAALGQAIRAVGAGKRALIIQFIKSREWQSGEDKFLKRFKIQDSRFKIIKGGLGFVGILGDKVSFENHKKSAQKTWESAKKFILNEKYDLIVLDEINVALKLKLLSFKEVLEFFKNYSVNKKMSEKIDVILTGRGAPQLLMNLADIATEMREIKYKCGKAKIGVEY